MRFKSAVLWAMFLVLVGCGTDDPAETENADQWDFENQEDPDAGLDADEPDADESDADEMDADESDADESDADEPDADEPDADEPDADEPSCDDGELNGDETDIDCGGSCDSCEEGLSCVEDGDCESDHCHEEVCVAPRLDLGEVCEEDFECSSGLCEENGEERICMEACDVTCSQPGMACFEGFCVSEDYCSDASGFGEGPGCEGSFCSQCHADATCAQVGDVFECNCREGYAGDGVICEDIDECADGVDSCHELATCENTPGSYLCECPAGYEGDGLECTAINECETGAHTCHQNATCINLAVGYDCVCDEGYEGDGNSCSDINECALGIDECGENAFCVNVQGGYGCSCAAGYEGDPWSQCTDIDECAEGTDSCDENATCTNRVGSYDCTCHDGFIGNGKVCDDIDECALGTADCDVNAICTNTPGSFECECADDFSGDGFTCQPYGESCDDAILVGDIPFSHQSDTSLASNHYTVESSWCPALNFQLGGNNGQIVYSFTPQETAFYRIVVDSQYDAGIFVVTDCGDLANSCVGGVDNHYNSSGGIEELDVEMQAGQTYFIVVSGWASSSVAEGEYEILISPNQCLNGTDNCGAYECIKGAFESHSCVCPEAGYEWHVDECVDIDECDAGTDSCWEGSTCINTDGSYFCACGQGPGGEPLACDDPLLEGNSCANPFVIEGDLPFEVTGDTRGRGSAMEIGVDQCPEMTWPIGTTSDDQIYAFTPQISGDYMISVEPAADFDPALYVITTCGEGASCVGGADNNGVGVDEIYTLSATEGTTYFIIVDGYSTFYNENGAYQLRVEEAP